MAGASKDDIAKALEAFSTGSSTSHHEDVLAGQKRSVREDAPLPAGHVAEQAAPAAAAVARTASRVPATHRQLELKRTMIPLLLTIGAMLPLGGLASILMGDDSLIAAGLTLPAVMIVLGLLILGAAVLTMLQVKHAQSAGAR